MSKHTPGPWATPAANVFRVFAWKDNQPVRCIVDDTMPHEVCFGKTLLYWPDGDAAGYEAAANARLIAAAPELLAACQKAVKELNEIRARDGVPYTHSGYKASVTEEYFSSVVDECFAAIAKATGGAS